MDEVYNSSHTGSQIDEGVDKALNLNVKNGDKDGAVREGVDTSATGAYSHAEGYETIAAGQGSHAEGCTSAANGEWSHAEGNNTVAEFGAHSEGLATKALGDGSHAEGSITIAGGFFSHAEGENTIASHAGQHVQGRFNVPDGDYEDVTERANPGLLHIVGNGDDENNRSNAHTLDQDGTAWFAGNVYVGSTGGKNRDAGSKKLATEEYVDSHGGVKVKQYTGTLLASGWVVDSSGYPSQTISIEGLITEYEVDPQWDVSLTGTDYDADRAILNDFTLIYNFITGAGTLTAQCLGAAPTVNIPVKVVTFT